MKNIKLSKTFSISILLIVIGFFLTPNIISSISLYQLDARERNIQNAFQKEIADRKNILRKSFQNLRIKDKKLEKCISNELETYMNIHPSSTGGINKVSELKCLRCFSRNIVSIEGIQGLSGLISIDLNDNDISDISPLLSLKNLETLYLDGNKPNNPEIVFDIPTLTHVALPDLSSLYCADVIKLTKSAKFEVSNYRNSTLECIGADSRFNNIDLLYAKKRSGVELTHEEEMAIIQHETNKIKAEYNRKREEYINKY